MLKCSRQNIKNLLKEFTKKTPLLIGHPDHVPVGIYAMQALNYLKHGHDGFHIPLGYVFDSPSIIKRIGEGEAEAALIYASDLIYSANITTIAEISPLWHDEVSYHLINLRPGLKAVEEMIVFLNSDKAAQIYHDFGFLTAQ